MCNIADVVSRAASVSQSLLEKCSISVNTLEFVLNGPLMCCQTLDTFHKMCIFSQIPEIYLTSQFQFGERRVSVKGVPNYGIHPILNTFSWF